MSYKTVVQSYQCHVFMDKQFQLSSQESSCHLLPVLPVINLTEQEEAHIFCDAFFPVMVEIVQWGETLSL